MWGMRDGRLVAVVGNLGIRICIDYHTLNWIRILFSLVEFSPSYGVTHC
jgi:hypothetical protein